MLLYVEITFLRYWREIMAFDGITDAAVVKECRELLTGSRIYKIAQPEADELQDRKSTRLNSSH